jgi:hypothetical protein
MSLAFFMGANQILAGSPPGRCQSSLARLFGLKGSLRDSWATAGLTAKFPEFLEHWEFLEGFQNLQQSSTLLGKSFAQWSGRHRNGMWFNISLSGWVSTHLDVKSIKAKEPMPVIERFAAERGFALVVEGRDIPGAQQNILNLKLPTPNGTDIQFGFHNPQGVWKGGAQFAALIELRKLLTTVSE